MAKVAANNLAAVLEIQQHSTSDLLQILKLQPSKIDIVYTTFFLGISLLLHRCSGNCLSNEYLKILLQNLDRMLVDFRTLVREMLIQEPDQEWLRDGWNSL